MTTQRTSKPVSEGLARQIGRQTEDAARNYPGSLAILELAKGHPGYADRLYRLFDELAGERAQTLAITERLAFMTVKLGTHPNNAALRKILTDEGNRIGDWASDILKKVQVAPEPTEVEIVVATVAELGFLSGATRQQIYDKALSLGLELLPAEVGPQMRLQYQNQPNEEWILIGMEPISASDGDLHVFFVARNGDDRWLNANYDNPASVWDAGNRWAFRRN